MLPVMVSRIVILNGVLARAEKYQRTGRRVNQRSQWSPMREAACEKSLTGPCWQGWRHYGGCKGRGGLLAQELNRMESALGRASGRLNEGAEFRRGSGGQPQMGEDLGHHRRIFDGGEIVKGPPHCGQAALSISNTRLSN